MYVTLLKHNMRVTFRQRAELAQVLVFPILCVVLFPLAVGSDIEVLRTLANGLVWLTILLGVHLLIPGIWRQDLLDGTLEQLTTAPVSVEWIVLAKVTCVWMVLLGALCVLVPWAAVSFNQGPDQVLASFFSLIVATIPLSFLAVVGGLMVDDRRQSALLSLIVLLPLYVPLLIIGSASCEGGWFSLLLLLGLSLALCPVLLYLAVGLVRSGGRGVPNFD